MGNVGGLLRKNIRTAKTPQGTKFSSVPVEAISLGDRKLAFRLVSIYIYTHFLILTYSQLHPNGEEACPVSEEDQDEHIPDDDLSEELDSSDAQAVNAQSGMPGCKCTGKCKTRRCLCKKMELLCSLKCNCNDCENLELD